MRRLNVVWISILCLLASLSAIRADTGNIDTNNSTTTPLVANGVFTGSATFVRDYSTISVISFSDQAGASLVLQWSSDGTNWDAQDVVNPTPSANVGVTANFSVKAAYVRVVYTNGTADQTVFRLQVLETSVKSPPLITANAAAGTTGTDLLGSGVLSWDGVNWQKWDRSVITNPGHPLDVTSSGGLSACVTQCTSPWITGGEIWDGSAWVPARQVDPFGAISILGSGIQAEAPYIYDGSGVWSPLLSSQMTGDGTVGSTIQQVALYVFDQGSTFNHLRTGGFQENVNTDGTLAAANMVWTGASYARQRMPSAFRAIQAAALGNTALWTPSPGKRFRLMRWRYTVTGSATTAGGPADIVISLFDGASGATGQQDTVTVPAAAATLQGQLVTSPWIDLGNGYLSTAANNVLNVNLSAALATGTVTVQVCVTEE